VSAGLTRARRAGLGAGVVLALALALAAGALATELSDWWYWRVDLSERGRNSVDRATLERIDNLADELVVHTFLRPLASPYDGVSSQALRRVTDYLHVVQSARRGKLSVVHHDLSDLEAVQEVQRSLGSEGENLVVVEYRGRRARFGVFGEAVSVDWGNPTLDAVSYLTERGIPNVIDPRTWNPRPGAYQPARLLEASVESVFAAAVARVASEDSPRVVFSTGHGEPAIDGTTAGSLSALSRELAADGFQVGTWDPASGGVPADCAVLAVLGPRQALASGALERIRAYLDRGGRVVASASEEEPAALDELLRPYGLGLVPGVVCEAVRDESGSLVEGVPQCAVLSIGGRGLAEGHPVSDLLRRNGLRLVLSHSAALERGAEPGGGQILDLVHTSPEAWRDLRMPPAGTLNYALDQELGERVGPATLIALVERRATADVGAVRLLAAGSTGFLVDQNFAKNRAFLRAAFNWMAEREERVDVAPVAEDRTVLDVARGRGLGLVSALLIGVLPASALVTGLCVAWRRRR
jgi:hypothetical protein